MRIVAGAVLCLAGAVVLGAGTVANAIVSAAGKSGEAPGSYGIMGGGILLGLVGLVVFVAGLVESRHVRRSGPESGYVPGNVPFVPGLVVRQRPVPAETSDEPGASVGDG
jgi:drug/metabolite transporter (DMT)-like permease